MAAISRSAIINPVFVRALKDPVLPKHMDSTPPLKAMGSEEVVVWAVGDGAPVRVCVWASAALAGVCVLQPKGLVQSGNAARLVP
jgi:hypothetical protein